MKNPTSFRLSPQALKILTSLAKRFGLSKTAVVEMALREKAEK